MMFRKTNDFQIEIYLAINLTSRNSINFGVMKKGLERKSAKH